MHLSLRKNPKAFFKEHFRLIKRLFSFYRSKISFLVNIFLEIFSDLKRANYYDSYYTVNMIKHDQTHTLKVLDGIDPLNYEKRFKVIGEHKALYLNLGSVDLAILTSSQEFKKISESYVELLSLYAPHILSKHAEDVDYLLDRAHSNRDILKTHPEAKTKFKNGLKKMRNGVRPGDRIV
jgi:hypothetical protein